MQYTFQATGGETEIFFHDDEEATPVALVPFAEGADLNAHQRYVRELCAAPELADLLRRMAQMQNASAALRFDSPLWREAMRLLAELEA